MQAASARDTVARSTAIFFISPLKQVIRSLLPILMKCKGNKGAASISSGKSVVFG